MTLAELELGVLAARSDEERARRAETLMLARASVPLPVSETVASAFAQIIDDCRRAQRRATVIDVQIAATAIAHGVPLYTQDADFDVIAAAHPRLDVRRI